MPPSILCNVIFQSGSGSGPNRLPTIHLNRVWKCMGKGRTGGPLSHLAPHNRHNTASGPIAECGGLSRAYPLWPTKKWSHTEAHLVLVVHHLICPGLYLQESPHVLDSLNKNIHSSSRNVLECVGKKWGLTDSFCISFFWVINITRLFILFQMSIWNKNLTQLNKIKLIYSMKYIKQLNIYIYKVVN